METLTLVVVGGLMLSFMLGMLLGIGVADWNNERLKAENRELRRVISDLDGEIFEVEQYLSSRRKMKDEG